MNIRKYSSMNKLDKKITFDSINELYKSKLTSNNIFYREVILFFS